MGGSLPFPWPMQPHTSPSTSPPSSPVSGTTLWQRPPHRGGNSFTIDAILGRKQQEADAAINRHRREERHCRPVPYPTSISSEHSSSVSSISQGQSSGGGKTKVKRVRTIFTADQLERLEAEFARTQYMVGPGRLYLAASLNLTEAQVKVWFQNRRIKWRKQYMEQQHAKLATRDSGSEDPPVAVDDDEDDDRSPSQSPASTGGILEVLDSSRGQENSEEVDDEDSNDLAQLPPQSLQALPQCPKVEPHEYNLLKARLTAVYQQQQKHLRPEVIHQSEPENLTTVPREQ